MFRASNEDLAAFKRLVEGLGGGEIVYRSPRVERTEAPKRFPQLAVRRDRTPNATGANLMGMTRVGDDSATGGLEDIAGHDGIVLVLGDALEDQPPHLVLIQHSMFT